MRVTKGDLKYNVNIYFNGDTQYLQTLRWLESVWNVVPCSFNPHISLSRFKTVWVFYIKKIKIRKFDLSGQILLNHQWHIFFEPPYSHTRWPWEEATIFLCPETSITDSLFSTWILLSGMTDNSSMIFSIPLGELTSKCLTTCFLKRTISLQIILHKKWRLMRF